MLAATPLPLLPLRILFLNICLDVFPAGTGGGKGDASIMNFPPRDLKESIIITSLGNHFCIRSLIAVFVLGAFSWRFIRWTGG